MLDLVKINRITQLDKKNMFERTLKLTEEVGEVSEAILDYLNNKNNNNAEHIIEESIDCVLIIASLMCMIDENYKNNNQLNIEIDTVVTEPYEYLSMNLSKKLGKIAESILSYNNTSGCQYKKKTVEDIINELTYTLNYATFIITKVCKENNISTSFIKKLTNDKITKWENKCTK